MKTPAKPVAACGRCAALYRCTDAAADGLHVFKLHRTA